MLDTKQTIKLVAVSDFVKRQRYDSKYSHYDGTWDELERLVSDYIKNGDNIHEGYRDGVILVDLPVDRFWSSVVNIQQGLGDGSIKEIKAVFKPRQEGERPYLQIYAIGSKQRAKKVQVVLYRHDVLLEGNEQSQNSDWEIISINASPIDKDIPMDNTTRTRNVLKLKGGTDVRLGEKTAEELVAFVKDTAESSLFWSQHIMVQPE